VSDLENKKNNEGDDKSQTEVSLAEKLAIKEATNKLHEAGILPEFTDYFALVKEKIENQEKNPEKYLEEGEPSINISPEEFNKLITQVSSPEFSERLKNITLTPEQKQKMTVFNQSKAVIEAAIKDKPGSFASAHQMLEKLASIDGLEAMEKFELQQISALKEKAEGKAWEAGKFLLAQGIDFGMSYVPYVGEAKDIYEGIAGYSVSNWIVNRESELSTGMRAYKILSGTYKLVSKHVDLGITSNLLTGAENTSRIVHAAGKAAEIAGRAVK